MRQNILIIFIDVRSLTYDCISIIFIAAKPHHITSHYVIFSLMKSHFSLLSLLHLTFILFGGSFPKTVLDFFSIEYVAMTPLLRSHGTTCSDLSLSLCPSLSLSLSLSVSPPPCFSIPSSHSLFSHSVHSLPLSVHDISCSHFSHVCCATAYYFRHALTYSAPSITFFLSIPSLTHFA